MKTTLNYIDRYLKKNALSKGVYVKTIDMPLKLFVRLVKQLVFSTIPLINAEEIINEAVNKCGALYEDNKGIPHIHLEDSNMPGLTEQNFDRFNFHLLEGILARYELTEREQHNLIFRLSLMIENIAEKQRKLIAN